MCRPNLLCSHDRRVDQDPVEQVCGSFHQLIWETSPSRDINSVHTSIPPIALKLSVAVKDICERSTVYIEARFNLPNDAPFTIDKKNIPGALSTFITMFLPKSV